MNRIIPLVLAVALFMENMDATVIATSLPAIAADIGADPISLKLALTAYFVALAIFIPASGWVADRFGTKRVFRVAILVFVLGSIACAFADSLLTFVMARFLQGVGGSMMTPLARLVLVRTTPRNALVAAMAWLTIPAMIGPLTGPPLGGFLTTFLSWHWIFWINVPIGLAGIVLVTKYLPADEGRTARPFDLPGLVLAAICFAGIMFGVSVVSLPAIPPAAGYAAIATGLISGALYLRHARRAAYPILDPKLLRLPIFRNALMGNSLHRLGIGALPFLMPLMLQLVFGLTPFESGMITFAAAGGALISKFLAGRFFALVGFRNALIATAVIGSLLIGFYAFLPPGTPMWVFIASLFVGGIVRSFFFTGSNAFVFADVDEPNASQATAINSVAQQLSIAGGVAVGGTVLELASSTHAGGLQFSDFQVSWIVVMLVSLLSALPFLRLPADAGSNVSGHRIAKVERDDP